MEIEFAKSHLIKIEEDPLLQNFIAQADSRYILLNVEEPEENFPPFTINDNSLKLLAFKYLSIGCSLAEHKLIRESIKPLEKGASILEFIYLSKRKEIDSRYYLLCCALAYYPSFHYSKAYIVLKEVAYNTFITALISSFMKREYDNLLDTINKILLNDENSDDNLSMSDKDEENTESLIYSILLAKSFNLIFQYYLTGNKSYVEISKDIVEDLKNLAEINEDPGFWWLIRLLKIICSGIDESSPWILLPKLIGGEHKILNDFIKSWAFSSPRPIVELFLSQRSVLPKTLDLNSDGVVISIPTSSGKTRIAEIAIIQTLINNPESKVLYLAPFKSLAFEVELSFSRVFTNLGFEVSHLYGGNQQSKIDIELINEAHIIIATPEKTKAIVRGNRELLQNIKLLIVDEGHLIGANKRLIINELFLEELKKYIFFELRQNYFTICCITKC